MPQIFGLLRAGAPTLAAVGALIGYIHHIPESINIMDVTAQLGEKLRPLRRRGCSMRRTSAKGSKTGSRLRKDVDARTTGRGHGHSAGGSGGFSATVGY